MSGRTSKVADCRTFVGSIKLVGVSPIRGSSRQAVRNGADYIGCCPTLAREKAFEDFPGLEYLPPFRPKSLPAFASAASTARIRSGLETGFRRWPSAALSPPQPTRPLPPGAVSGSQGPNFLRVRQSQGERKPRQSIARDGKPGPR